jgi:hypothetical protein
LSPARAAQAAKTCFALTGLISYVILTQGFGRSAAFTLGCAAARFQRSKGLNLTPMPFGGFSGTNLQRYLSYEFCKEVYAEDAGILSSFRTHQNV